MSQEEEREETLLNEDAQRDLQRIDNRYLIEIGICKSYWRKNQRNLKRNSMK